MFARSTTYCVPHFFGASTAAMLAVIAVCSREDDMVALSPGEIAEQEREAFEQAVFDMGIKKAAEAAVEHEHRRQSRRANQSKQDQSQQFRVRVLAKQATQPPGNNSVAAALRALAREDGALYETYRRRYYRKSRSGRHRKK